MFSGTGNPVKGCMECIDCTDAGKGHIHHIAIPETFTAVSLFIPLSKHIDDVGCSGFRSIKSRFSPQVHSPNRVWIQTIPINDLHHCHGTHGCSVFVNIGNGHCFETQSFVEFTKVSATQFSKIPHVHVQTGEMNCDIVDTYAGLTVCSHQ